MPEFNAGEKVAEFQSALEQFLENVSQDKNVLAIVLVGSLAEETIWSRERIHLWIIETDGVTKRLKADGNDERIWRTLVQNGINFHAELIPRSRFKQMVEGSSRTAFSCNFFAKRELIYCADPSIEKWFETANSVAAKDQEKELLVAMTWLIDILRYARKQLEIKKDPELAKQMLIWAAHNVAAVEIVRQGEVFEDQAIYRGMQLQPKLFKTIYTELIAKRRSIELLTNALQAIEDYVQQNWESDLKPLTHYLSKQKRTVPLTEICDHFAHTQLYPWHIESACEWMERNGRLDKLSLPYKLTTKSRIEFEEPAYSLDV